MKGDPECLPTKEHHQTQVQHLVNAILGNRRVELLYYSMASDARRPTSSNRLRLVFGDGALYLRAFVPEYKDIRTFAVTRHAHGHAPRGHVHAARGGRRSRSATRSASTRARPWRSSWSSTPASRKYVLERIVAPVAGVSPRPTATVRLHALKVSDDLALRSWILGFGRNVRVVTPVSLAEWVRRGTRTDAHGLRVHAGGRQRRPGTAAVRAVAPHLLGLDGPPAPTPGTSRAATGRSGAEGAARARRQGVTPAHSR